MAQQNIYPDGSYSYILHVTSAFVDADLTTPVPAATVRWKWVAAEVVFISSFAEDIKDQIRNADIETVVAVLDDISIPKYSIVLPIDNTTHEFPNVSWGGDKTGVDVATWSAYSENYQWPLLLINAITLKASGTNGGQYVGGSWAAQDYYDCPEWKLYADANTPLEGRGIVVGTYTSLPGTQPDRADSAKPTLHPEFMFYRRYATAGAQWTDVNDIEDEVAPEAMFTEDPAADEVHLQGGLLGYDPSRAANDQPKQFEFIKNGTPGPNTNSNHFLGYMFSRGVGVKTLANGTPNDGTTIGQPQPVPKGHFPEMDGVSYVAAVTGGSAVANHAQIGPSAVPVAFGGDANGALKGRMRGVIPCAKCICYNVLGEPQTFKRLVMALYAAVTHKVQVFAEPDGTFVSTETAEGLRDVINSVWSQVRSSGMIYVSSHNHYGLTTGPAISDQSHVFGDSYNTLFAGGVGPRYYNPRGDLNVYDPNGTSDTYEVPVSRDNNLARPCGAVLSIFFGFPINLCSGGTGLSKKRDVVGPLASSDPYRVSEVTGYSPSTVFNSGVYGPTENPGVTVNFPGATFPIPNIGFHGLNLQEQSIGAYVVGNAAITLEAWKFQNGLFPNNVRKVMNIIKKRARDQLGPAVDDFIVTFPRGNNVMMKRVAQSTGAAELTNGVFLWPTGTPPGTNPFGFAPGTFTTIPAAGIQEFDEEGVSPFVEYYFPSFPADGKGRDEMYGHGVIDLYECVQSALS